MRILNVWIFLWLTIIFLFPKNLEALEDTINCSDRYVMLVNPVRGRSLWVESSVNPLKNQYDIVKQYDFPVTWLLQYDVLEDKELISVIGDFNNKQEKGVFLEVSEQFAKDSRVIYPYSSTWYSPDAVFFSAYTQSERRRLIDNLFVGFKKEFGFYPKSVGAWWIDSYSLNYMKEKYGIKSAIIVADQKTTDNYGVWGQWWGVPYYPSKANILTPAGNLENKQDVVVIQWALRDPVLAIGEGTKFSNFSLQANDYIRQGENTAYFEELINTYLDCQNPLGQVTVGLETGSDSVAYKEEYERQLEVLKRIPNLQFVSMQQFYEIFSKKYPEYPKEIIIGAKDSKWIMNPEKRVNERFNDIIKYNPEVSFSDYFIAAKDKFLNRVLTSENRQKNQNINLPLGFITILILGIYAYFKGRIKVWAISVSFCVASFGLILRSGVEFGWQVFYGPVVADLPLYQIALPFIAFFLLLFLERFKMLILWTIPLSFAFDPLIQSLRASFISEKFYLGISLDALRFLGISLSRRSGLEFVNLDFPAYLAEGLLKIDYLRIWQNFTPTLFFYPLAHIVLAFALSIVLKRSFKFKRLIISVLIFFFLVHLSMIFNADPLFVRPNY